MVNAPLTKPALVLSPPQPVGNRVELTKTDLLSHSNSALARESIGDDDEAREPVIPPWPNLAIAKLK